MLTTPEADEIRTVLTQILANNGGRPWLQTVFGGPGFMIGLNEIVGNAANDEQVAGAAIEVCVAREWTDDPPWLVRLLLRIGEQAGVGGIGQVSKLDAIIQRLRDKINILDEAWYVHWVQDGLPFMDRSELRDSLKELSRTQGRPVLRIEGDPGTGKTYSNELLQHVSLTAGWSFKVINVVVQKESAITMNALSLALIIVGEMGFDIAPKDIPLPDLKVHDIPLLQTWILKSARGSQKRWWLCLDGFGLLPEENTARSLIQGLADKIANGGFRDSLRLILIDYDKPLARVEEEKIAFDRPQPRLTDDKAMEAIRDCLDHLYTQLGKTPEDGELDAKTKAVLASVPANAPWIAEVSKRLRAAAKGIRNGR